MLFFSSGTSAEPKGILNSHRAVAIQLSRWRRLYDNLDDDVRCWPANGFFWSGVFSMAHGLTFGSGGALVLQPTFEAAEALELWRKQVNYRSAGRTNGLARGGSNWVQWTSSLRYVDRAASRRHTTVQRNGESPRAMGSRRPHDHRACTQ